MRIDFKTLTPSQTYHLMVQSIVPRPIAWVLTENENTGTANKYNLAPFSYFNAVASSPPMLMISITTLPDGSPKNTLVNIQRSQQLVIHIASANHIDALNQSSASLAYGDSELTASALGTTPFNDFALPRLSEAKIAFACTLDHIHLIGDAPQTLIFARIESAYFDEDIVQTDAKGRTIIDAASLDPLARLGGNNYAYLGEYVSRKRPS